MAWILPKHCKTETLHVAFCVAVAVAEHIGIVLAQAFSHGLTKVFLVKACNWKATKIDPKEWKSSALS